ncbi:LxmA leader domain family RiPP [Streptomyces sp. AJS327]|uniref:LxmA leader domain family RiPP n=1 Tax=Streptomyces sp. AJS327 TaxID=2545265 RepID=UPI0015DFF3D7|nr:LxmA leader domain family RiPP [Streptomyces sp. AJS327]
MNENMTDQLIAGYTAYTSAEEFGPVAEGEQPAITPSTATVTVGIGIWVTKEKSC